MCDVTITVDPKRGRGGRLTFYDAQAAVDPVRAHSGAAVLYLPVDTTDLPEDICPGLNYLHLMAPEVQAEVRSLSGQMYGYLAADELARARKVYDSIFSLLPGKMGLMLDSYTTDWHLWIQRQPVVDRLMRILYGDNYVWLDNRACIRLGTAQAKPPRSPARQSIKAKPKPKPPARPQDMKWHKEGRPGEYGYIPCLPLRRGTARRSFAMVPDERRDPFPQPTNAKMFQPIDAAQILAKGLQRVALDVFVPEGMVAIIIFDHNMVHGIHPHGVGVQLYISAADGDKVRWLDGRYQDLIRRRVYEGLHCPEMRQPPDYYSSLQIGFLYGCCSIIWPSGKPIPAHSVQGQSVGSNRAKFPGDDYSFRLRTDGTVARGPDKRQQLDALGLRVPDLAWTLPGDWVRDPADLPVDQQRRWGFRV
jgi:hypothetical protein